MNKLFKYWLTSKEVKRRVKNINQIREELRIKRINNEFNEIYTWVLKNIKGKTITTKQTIDNQKYVKESETIFTCRFDDDTTIKTSNTLTSGDLEIIETYTIYLNGDVYRTFRKNAIKMYKLMEKIYTENNNDDGVDKFLAKIKQS
jgi:hypothetical protein